MKTNDTKIDTDIQIGFVGREDGMTDRQKESLHIELARCISQFKIDKRFFHCASCCGAAYEAYFIAKKLGYNIVVHPMLDPKFLAFCMGEMLFNEFSKNGNLIIAAPKEDRDMLKNGSCGTIRYANKLNVNTVIIYP